MITLLSIFTSSPISTWSPTVDRFTLDRLPRIVISPTNESVPLCVCFYDFINGLCWLFLCRAFLEKIEELTLTVETLADAATRVGSDFCNGQRGCKRSREMGGQIFEPPKEPHYTYHSVHIEISADMIHSSAMCACFRVHSGKILRSIRTNDLNTAENGILHSRTSGRT